MKNKILKLVLISFTLGITAPTFALASSSLDQAKNSGVNANLTFDGSKAFSPIDTTATANQVASPKPPPTPAVAPAPEPPKPGLLKNSWEDLKTNKKSYLMVAGAGAFAGWLLFGGLLGPIGGLLFVTAFVLLERNWK